MRARFSESLSKPLNKGKTKLEKNMSHCIESTDKGIVGLVGKLGKTWHGLPQYKQIEGFVPLEQAEAIANYEVVKKPLFIAGASEPVAGAFCLYRTDLQIAIYPAVGDRYTVANNLDLMQFVDKGILQKYPNIKIESVGTLSHGQGFFLNLIVSEHTVKGDISPTVTRLAIFNFHGGKAVSACIHQTRIVCMNTLRVAQAEGKANATMKNFRHTASVGQKLENYTVDLAGIIGETEESNKNMDLLSSTAITTKQFEMFIENVFPKENAKEGRSKSIAINKQSAVKEIYEGRDNLTALDNTAYRALNAVTDWADHEMSLRGSGEEDADNVGKRFMSNIHAGGASDKIKQSAFKFALELV
jgi:phage/plasmid-like protein (TIGR03299 family)